MRTCETNCTGVGCGCMDERAKACAICGERDALADGWCEACADAAALDFPADARADLDARAELDRLLTIAAMEREANDNGRPQPPPAVAFAALVTLHPALVA
jgi:hypothetical protein